MPRSVSRFALVLLLVATAAAGALPRPVARAFLDAGVPLDAVAVVIQDVGSRRAVVAHRANVAMAPASVMKLVTTYAALDLLGRDYRWQTRAYTDGPVVGGVLQGNLVLVGSGDPKITIEQWQVLMTALRARGIDRISGDLVLDSRAFDVPPHDRATFDGAPLRPYNVGPDALLVNFNSVRFTFTPYEGGAAAAVSVEPPLPAIRVRSAPALRDAPCDDWRGALLATFDDHGDTAEVSFPGGFPASCGERSWYVALLEGGPYVHAMFTTYFRAAGGGFEGRWRRGQVPAGAVLVATLESPPLYDIVRDVNKLSNNVMARQIFLTLALPRGGPEPQTPPATLAGANAAVQRWLAARRIDMPGLVLENGSGLSRRERATAGGLVRLLLSADRSAVREEFSSSLAVAATDGTVERRFQNARVAGQAFLKTGTLEGVRALAGYVLDPEGRRFAVAVLVNGPAAARAQPALDAVVQWTYRDGAAWAHVIPPR